MTREAAAAVGLLVRAAGFLSTRRVAFLPALVLVFFRVFDFDRALVFVLDFVLGFALSLVLAFGLAFALDLLLDLLLDFFRVLAMIPPASIYKQIVHTPMLRLKPVGLETAPASVPVETLRALARLDGTPHNGYSLRRRNLKNP